MEDFNKDFISSLTNEKYYLEKDLQHIYNSQDKPYSEKIRDLKYVIRQIHEINSITNLFISYITPPEKPQQNTFNEKMADMKEKEVEEEGDVVSMKSDGGDFQSHKE